MLFKKYKSIAVLTLLSVVLAATGCLKDELQDDNLTVPEMGGSPSLIEIPGPVRATTSYNTAYVISLPASEEDTTFSVVFVRLAADQPAPEDIVVELELAPELLSAYNDSMDTELEQPDASMFTFSKPDLKLTIPKGKREGSLEMTMIPDIFAVGQWGFGFRIKSVSNAKYGISGNLKNAVVTVGVRNMYDGAYDLSGFHNRPTLNDPYHNERVYMETTGPNSVKMYWVAASVDAHPIHGATTYYGNLTTEFTFDPDTYKLIKVDNPYTPGSPPFTIGPALDSRYDPDTKTIYAQYYYNGNLERMFTDTIVYVGARP
ncbi:MAG: DUF1735 domain-containing protein [Candidatus Pseudobacter hemicellulosilyticus]|uniref:DUF1735 domain-containing protein n=1 Tax=Candidatus Pseudobacter hemicellulosilyticus TaxID=3121375 RepID=A0AAJ6BHE4_9BACT|nr:MAG: DUF1735 domain-containing protein [Pseudobacter sp.]